MKKLFLIDGFALIHRSFHAFSGRTQLTSKGNDIGMVYGFLLSILSICKNEKPELMAIVFDTAAPTFRHKMFDDYKAHRAPLDESIKVQLPLLDEVIKALNFPTLRLDGWEADDVMGTLAKRGEKLGIDTFLVTGDKDFYQLVNDSIKVYTLPFKSAGKPTIYDAERVKEKFGVYPEKVIDVLALMGDTADNVPGVPSIGPKRAIELIDQFGSLENLLASIDKVSSKNIKEKLAENIDTAKLSKVLVTIDTDAPFEMDPHTLTYGPLYNSDSIKLLSELEFLSIINQITSIEGGLVPEKKAKSTNKKYETVDSIPKLKAMIAEIEKCEMLSFDVETTSKDSMVAELVGFSFSIREEEAWYVPANFFKADMFELEGVFEKPRMRPKADKVLLYILKELKQIYENPDIKKTGQNVKYDMTVLKCYDIEVRGVAFDTMLASFTIDSSIRQHNIDSLAAMYLDFTKIPTSELIGSGAKQLSMLDVKLERITEYACEDADIALRLTNLFQQKIKENEFEKLMFELEVPLIDVLLKMEYTGIKLDTDLLSKMSKDYEIELEGLTDKIYSSAGSQFNINSPTQMADILYVKLGLPTGRKTKTGFSTDIDELERLAPVHELPEMLLRYRHLSKLKSTYIDALPLMVHPVTGRVHTSYSQTIAATGRLSSNEPNLQNIPIRSEEGGKIRSAFIAGEPDWILLAADYSQIELRIMAHLSGDEKLKQAFLDGVDIHRATAAWMNDVTLEEVTSDMRRQAKEVNFGVLYGMGEFGLSQRLGITRARAKEFIQSYFTNFSRVKEYIDEIISSVKEKEYVETMMGRRRPLPDINASNFVVRSNAERIAVNTPIQGSAADLIKVAMIHIHNALNASSIRANMLLQVHDELVFEVHKEDVELLSHMVKDKMTNALQLSVPLEVGIGIGNNWLEAHD